MEELINQIKLHQDNPVKLSEIGLEIAANLFTHNTNMANAELKEKECILNYLKEGATSGQKRSVAESELYGITETLNNYGKLKVQGEAVMEIINSIKKRIEVLNIERQRV